MGSVLIGTLERGAVGLADLSLLRASSPWCSACLLDTDPPFDRRVIAAFEPYPGSFGRIRAFSGGSLPVPGILEAVRRRTFPAAIELADFVAKRIGRTDLVPTLRDCFEPNRAGSSWSRPPHRSTLSRQLRDLKPYTARDWSSLARLVRVLASPESLGGVSRDRTAFEHEVDGRTLSGWLARYLRLSFREARERVGWEWVIEAGLRTGGYVSGPAGNVIPALARRPMPA
jgi:hypothetical protein